MQQTQSRPADMQHIESLRAVVGNESLTHASRTAAAKEIIRLTTAGKAAGTVAEDTNLDQIRHDDEDVLALTAPLDEQGKMLAAMSCFTLLLTPKSLPVAKAIVAGRRRYLPLLAIAANVELSDGDRLAAINELLPILQQLSTLAQREAWDWENLQGVEAGWLLGHMLRPDSPPQTACALWPWR
jgi:hypothetical protein